jgi:predicted GH43/DUF377 family glycosyl hydrolase
MRVSEVKKDGIEIENQYRFGNDESFCKYVLETGGTIKPLIVPGSETNGTGLMNPSILNFNGKIIINIRHVNYTFYHSEKKLFQHPWGPLTYLHPENDMHLRTWNWYGELDENLNIVRLNKIDTSTFDTYEPLWDFVGLEDARLVEWEGKLFITGVRRDTTTNGQGRMELSEIQVKDDSVIEISRFRIPPPKDKNSYCEKNWMPIIDKKYSYIKWSNPTEVVEIDFDNIDSKTTHITNYIPAPNDFRGGSQIIPFGDDHYIALIHEVDLFRSELDRKDAVYRHRFLIWDKDWNLIKYTKDFSMMNGHVEFAVGMCYIEDDVLITFGFQDNAAYVIKMKKDKLVEFVNDN